MFTIGKFASAVLDSIDSSAAQNANFLSGDVVGMIIIFEEYLYVMCIPQIFLRTLQKNFLKFRP